MPTIPRLAPLHCFSRPVAAATIPVVIAACTSAAPASPVPTATPAATASPTEAPTPTVAAPTATPGPTEIPYNPSASIPPGTLNLSLSAGGSMNLCYTYTKTDLSAPANKPFAVNFDYLPSGACGTTQAHNVAIRDGPVILFNPLPTIFGGQKVTYFIPQGLPAGSYTFFCIVHPFMVGTLTITP